MELARVEFASAGFAWMLFQGSREFHVRYRTHLGDKKATVWRTSAMAKSRLSPRTVFVPEVAKQHDVHILIGRCILFFGGEQVPVLANICRNIRNF